MTAAAPEPPPDARALRDRFLRWQCRCRQIDMREAMGRPGDAVTPALTLPGETAPLGHVITVLNRAWARSLTPELMHLCRSTQDPAQRREKALAFFAAAYFQSAAEFTDELTATFPPASPGAARIAETGACRLDFAAYNQAFALECRVRRLEPGHPLHAATWWHNLLFNPALPSDTVILAFKPDWEASGATP
jgi:hypothetical protein